MLLDSVKHKYIRCTNYNMTASRVKLTPYSVTYIPIKVLSVAIQNHKFFFLFSDLECSECFVIHIVQNYMTRFDSTNNIRSKLVPFLNVKREFHCVCPWKLTKTCSLLVEQNIRYIPVLLQNTLILNSVNLTRIMLCVV